MSIYEIVTLDGSGVLEEGTVSILHVSPDVVLQSLDCVRVVLIDSLLQVTPVKLSARVEVGGTCRPRVVHPS